MIDDACIQRIASGNVSLFEELFASWSEQMYYYAMRLTGDHELSKDVAQESFIAYWNKRASFDSIFSVKAFLYAIVRNQVYKHARDEHCHRDILERMPAEAETENLVIVAEVNRQVQEAVHSLPPQTREIIERSMNGLKVEEIATEMNISINTVKTLKKNGYKSLREKLGHLRFLLLLLSITR
ncbi:MAG: sigma-70 family RNA polymerase sigma factor [Odoribacteraceae bacterium]|jgi:RNA polymerase sigma-70 factor (ECF subfamily)|nr:sigma-70 family RNA polymerase sigma factor [Odoribacteraceae bacterium]